MKTDKGKKLDEDYDKYNKKENAYVKSKEKTF